MVIMSSTTLRSPAATMTNRDQVSTQWMKKIWKERRGPPTFTSTNWTVLKGMNDLDNVLDELYDLDNVLDELYDLDNVLDELYDPDNVIDNSFQFLFFISAQQVVQTPWLKDKVLLLALIMTLFLLVLRGGRPTCLIKAFPRVLKVRLDSRPNC